MEEALVAERAHLLVELGEDVSDEAGIDASLMIVEQADGHVEAERADLVDELAGLRRR